MKRILITGANGFVGKSLLNRLLYDSIYKIRVAVRNNLDSFPETVEVLKVDEIGPDTDWSIYLKKTDIVIHLAARVHMMKDTSTDPLYEFRRVNSEGTLNLARQAEKAGVKRFIFLSSIKVNGEETFGEAFLPEDKPGPQDPYGLSKCEAEEGLKKITKKSRMEYVIIRSPLVYGPGVKGNMQSMMKLIRTGLPLPLGKTKNKRSLVALENLSDFINCCIKHPKAANETFLISDGQDISTTELMKKMAKAMNKRLFLLPVPGFVFKVLTTILGKSGIYKRLFGNLQVDSTKARKLLDWKPIISMDEQLKKMV